MQLNSLKDLYLEQLKDLFSAEEQLTEALPKMASAASDPELKKAFKNHLQETKNQVARLRKVFKSLNEDPSGESCEAMEGLIAEGEDILEAEGDASTRDAALIAAAQRIEHYEISGYGTVVAYARTLGRSEDVSLLEVTLEEEKDADELLNDIALEEVNSNAAKSAGEHSGNGKPESAEDVSYDELYREARKRDIRGRSKMNKNQLAKAVEKAS